MDAYDTGTSEIYGKPFQECRTLLDLKCTRRGSSLPCVQGKVVISNSSLGEFGALGFEYGYHVGHLPSQRLSCHEGRCFEKIHAILHESPGAALRTAPIVDLIYVEHECPESIVQDSFVCVERPFLLNEADHFRHWPSNENVFLELSIFMSSRSRRSYFRDGFPH